MPARTLTQKTRNTKAGAVPKRGQPKIFAYHILPTVSPVVILVFTSVEALAGRSGDDLAVTVDGL